MACFQFYIEKLGPVRNSMVEFDGLTILTGDNGTGKTYIASAVFLFFDYLSKGPSVRMDLPEIFDWYLRQLQTSGEVEIDLTDYFDSVPAYFEAVSAHLSNDLGRLFGVAETYFDQDSFTASVVNLQLEDCLVGSRIVNESAGCLQFERPGSESKLRIHKTKDLEVKDLPHKYSCCFTVEDYAIGLDARPVYFSTSERSGIVIFQNTIDINRSRLLESAATEQDAARAFQLSRIPKTTISNLDLIRDAPTHLMGDYSEFAQANPELIAELDRLIGAKFVEVDKEIYLDYGGNSPISMKTASSSIRSLVDLNIFIKYVAKPGAILIIDEPELNLHPRNQIRLARLLVRLVKTGVRVFISTHSDFIIREIGLCVMLFDDSRQANLHKGQTQHIAADYGNGAEEVNACFAQNYALDPAKVRAYRTVPMGDNVSVESMDVNVTSGIAMPVFDAEITAQNQRLDFTEWGIGEVP